MPSEPSEEKFGDDSASSEATLPATSGRKPHQEDQNPSSPPQLTTPSPSASRTVSSSEIGSDSTGSSASGDASSASDSQESDYFSNGSSSASNNTSNSTLSQQNVRGSGNSTGESGTQGSSSSKSSSLSMGSYPHLSDDGDDGTATDQGNLVPNKPRQGKTTSEVASSESSADSEKSSEAIGLQKNALGASSTTGG